MKRLLCAIAVLGLSALGGAMLTGCETTEGFGEDVSHLGDEIDEAAEEEQED